MIKLMALIVRCLAPYRKDILGFAALSALAAAMSTAAPILMGRSLDGLVSHGTWLLVAGCAITSYVLNVSAEWLRKIVDTRGTIISFEVGRDDNERRIMALLDKPMSVHVDQKRREVTSGIAKLRWQLQNLVEVSVFTLLPLILTAVATIGYVATMSGWVAIALLVTLAAYVRFTWKFAPRRNESIRMLHKVTDEAEDFKQEAIENAMLVKAFANESFVRSMLDAARPKAAEVERSMATLTAEQMLGQQLIFLTGVAASSWIAYAEFHAGRMSIGGVAIVVAYANAVCNYVRSASWTIRTMGEVAVLLQRVDASLAHPSEDFESGRAMPIRGAVQFDHVSFGYASGTRILDDVSFSTQSGRNIAIVGESGAGKSTLLNLLMRLPGAHGGTIRIDAVPIEEVNLRSLRSQIGYVSQDAYHFHRTVADNIRFGRPDATDEEVRHAARLAKIDEYIETLAQKYDTVIGEKGHKLSGGQRQRISLARAFLRNPRILILDEPTSQQDSVTEAGIQESLAELMQGRTTFIVAHRLKTVMNADQILVLKDGRIAESGTHDELVQRKNGLYLAALKAQGMATDASVMPRSSKHLN